MDVICFSHLRWNFVYQRPQHLLSRFANKFRVFYFEEPVYNASSDNYEIELSDENVWIVTPHLKNNISGDDINIKQRSILNKLFAEMNIQKYFFWYYTPMALPFSTHLHPQLIVYDCMDELSAFKFASPYLKDLENQLLAKADIVFTGGHSLYDAKKHRHKNMYAFPSSIEKEHFLKARKAINDPDDQADIPYPRIGFYGVIDERFDIDLIREVALAKPCWQIVLIGPVVKIDPALLPRNKNIHYLGSKTYQQLPEYISGWQIAMVPFAINESTRFISPTKTPEYLAAGKPVISTPIADVVNPYGINNLVYIARTAQEFVQHAEIELSKQNKTNWLQRVDNFLCQNSWDITWQKMMKLISEKLVISRPMLYNPPLIIKSTKEKAYV